MYDSIREYNDGTLDKVISRKLLEISQLEDDIEDGNGSRNKFILLKVLIEDSMLYNMVRRLVSSSEDEFDKVLEEIMPAFEAELEDVPRAVIDNYRRGLSEEDIMTEDKALGYVDDIKGIATGRCRY